MSRRAISCAFAMLLAVGLFVANVATASAACRDDCYSSCCGSDSLCQGADEMKCLAQCLKDCGGDDVPAVPAPTPVEGS